MLEVVNLVIVLGIIVILMVAHLMAHNKNIQLMQRIRELESELRSVNAENARLCETLHDLRNEMLAHHVTSKILKRQEEKRDREVRDPGHTVRQ
jgi:predicted Holliday junction resolvase-like endonuclease